MNTLRAYISAKIDSIPVAGLSLGDFSVTVYRTDKMSEMSTAKSLVSSVALTREVGGGFYQYEYSGTVDFILYNYVIAVSYSGSTLLDETYWYAYDFDEDINTREEILRGSVMWTYIVYESNGTTPISGVTVRVTNDISGRNVLVSGVTNSLGQVEFMIAPNQMLYIWREKSSYIFVNPDVETV